MDPTTFEQVVAHLLNADHNVRLSCSYGEKVRSRQFDGYREVWRSEFVRYRIGIECKKWKKPVGVQSVEAFSKKIERCKIDQGIMISFKGFSSTAIDEAMVSNIDIYSFRPLEPRDVSSNIKRIDFYEIVQPFPTARIQISGDDVTPEEARNPDIRMRDIKDFDIFDEKGTKIGNLDRIAGALAEFEVLTRGKRAGRIDRDWTTQNVFIHSHINGRPLRIRVTGFEVEYKTRPLVRQGVFRHEGHYIMKNEATGSRQLIPLSHVKKISAKYEE